MPLTNAAIVFMFPIGDMGMAVTDETTLAHRTSRAAQDFGSMIRQRRRAQGVLQEQLALATGVGRRFLIDLEAGKPTCQLGKSLIVAEALGIGLADLLATHPSTTAAPESLDIPEFESGQDV